LFKFKKDQKVCEISGIKVGGCSRENPVLLIGTIFYKEEKLRKNGIDFNKAKQIVEDTLKISERTNIPFIPDVYFEENDDFEKIVDFISNFDIPFLIDSTEWEMRIKVLKHCNEIGLKDKIIYNSFSFGMTPQEKDELKIHRPRNAILLGFNPLDNSIEGKINFVKRKLLPMVQLAGVRNALLDTGVMPIGNGSLISIKTVIAFKSEFGLPTGNGIHNIISNWVKKKDERIKNILDSTVCGCQVLLGADFLLYGPIEASWRIFPTVEMIHEILKDE